jgi:hypothetical protein
MGWKALIAMPSAICKQGVCHIVALPFTLKSILPWMGEAFYLLPFLSFSAADFVGTSFLLFFEAGEQPLWSHK